MTEIQGKSILVRVSARFELARVRVIGSRLYIILKRIPAEAYRSHRSSHFADNLVILNKTPSKRRIETTANPLKLEKNDRAKVAINYPLYGRT